MTARKFRPTLETLEDRCTPASFSITAALGGGHSAVTLLVEVQAPPTPIAPEMVTIIRELPNGKIQEAPPNPCVPPNPGDPPPRLHDLFPPGAYRGWLQAADVGSDAFIVPVTGGGIFNGASGTLAVKDSTVLNNLALLGADLFNDHARVTANDSIIGDWYNA
jgi:hypothetical protein